MYIIDDLSTAFLYNPVTVHDIRQPAYPLEQTVLDYQRNEWGKSLRSLFQKGRYRDAYHIGKELSARFRADPDCSQFLRWETSLLFAKACIYFSPSSNDGLHEILRVNQEMEKELLEKPFFKRSNEERKQWLHLKGILFHLTGYDLWMNKGNLNTALKDSRLALGCYEKAGTLEEVATLHDNIGRILSLSDDREGALYEIAQGLEIRLSLGQPDRVALSYISYADTCLRFGNIDEARQYLEQAEKICIAEDNLRGIGLVSLLYGRLYRLMSNQTEYALEKRLSFLKMAVPYLEKAELIFHILVEEPIRTKDIKEEVVDVWDELIQIYQIMGRFA